MQSRAPKMVVPWARSQNEKSYHVYLDFVHCISNLVSYLVSGVHPSDRHFQVDVLTLKQYTSLWRFLDDRPPTIIKKLSTKSYAKPEMCPAKILLITTVRALERVRFWHEKVHLSTNQSTAFLTRRAVIVWELYSLVPIRRHGSISRHTFLFDPVLFPKYEMLDQYPILKHF